MFQGMPDNFFLKITKFVGNLLLVKKIKLSGSKFFYRLLRGQRNLRFGQFVIKQTPLKSNSKNILCYATFSQDLRLRPYGLSLASNRSCTGTASPLWLLVLMCCDRHFQVLGVVSPLFWVQGNVSTFLELGGCWPFLVGFSGLRQPHFVQGMHFSQSKNPHLLKF